MAPTKRRTTSKKATTMENLSPSKTSHSRTSDSELESHQLMSSLPNLDSKQVSNTKSKSQNDSELTEKDTQDNNEIKLNEKQVREKIKEIVQPQSKHNYNSHFANWINLDLKESFLEFYLWPLYKSTLKDKYSKKTTQEEQRELLIAIMMMICSKSAQNLPYWGQNL